jgi:hypothetical protein|tara:strand:+ start:2311 stop:3021 length:711 start_codon:yes stop_codon:yes gene_type:complete
MNARKLNREGLRNFEEYIEALRMGEKLKTPTSLLTDIETSEGIDLNIQLSDQAFRSRYELGEALVKAIGEQNLQSLVGDTGFWSWLALYWFDQLCPPQLDESRKPSMVYNYLLSQSYNHRPRHAIFTTWQLVANYGDVAQFLLCKELPVRGELVEQMMARQYYMSCEGVMGAAAQLYWDPEKLSFRSGSASRKTAGCVSRFVAWLQQLELTYDLFSLNAEDLLALMPPEFDRFRAV